MRYVSQHGLVFDTAGTKIFIRDIVVVALFVATLFVGMITFAVFNDGPVAYPGSNLALFMVSPAHTWIVSTITGKLDIQYATWTELKPESEGGNQQIYGDVTFAPADAYHVVLVG